MNFLHFSTNVGGLGQDVEGEPNDAGKFTRRQLYNRLKYIQEKYGRLPDAVGLQETMNSKVKLAPGYDLPAATDDNVFVNCTDGNREYNARRGVATYADIKSCFRLAPLDNTSEIVTTVHEYTKKKSRGSVASYMCCINVYRLKNGDAPSSSDDIKKYIANQVKIARNNGIHDFIVHGDFNDERFNLNNLDFRELTHPELYHKHHSHTAKRKIDKVFTNNENVRILEILDTCEFRSVNTENSLGHRGILLGIGGGKGGNHGFRSF